MDSHLAKAEKCVFNVRVTNIPPLYFQNEQGKWTGLTVDLAKVLLKEAGCKSDFEAIPWARSLELMRTGGLDMMMNLSMTEERRKFIHFIGPQMDETVQLFLREDIDVDIQSLDDLKKISSGIGYQRGTFYGKVFDEKLRTDPAFKAKLDISHSDELNLKKLESGRIVGVIGHTYAGVSTRKEFYKGNGYKIHPFIIHSNWVYFGFSKKTVSKELLAKLQKAYDKAKSEGKFEKVIESYK
jgi:ABC-type amino acid transport substrate-binding protein